MKNFALPLLFLAAPLAFSSPAAAPRLLAGCTGSVTVLIYDLGTRSQPELFSVVVGKGEPTRYDRLKSYLIPGEEVHFEAPGFHLEAITNLTEWSVGVLPGTDRAHPEFAEGHVWLASAAGEPIDLECTFH